jgi:hypothetical protein
MQFYGFNITPCFIRIKLRMFSQNSYQIFEYDVNMKVIYFLLILLFFVCCCVIKSMYKSRHNDDVS